MSCREYENGFLKLPTAVFSMVRRELIEAYNEFVEQRFRLGLQLYSLLEKIPAKNRPGPREAWFHPETSSFLRRLPSWADGEDLVSSCFSHNRLRKPTRKDFPLLKSTATVIPVGPFGSADLSKKPLLWWSVSENNHAREATWDHPVGLKFYQSLAKISWCRGSGGVFTGNDEYHQDEGRGSVGGGGEYVTKVFGPAGESEMSRFAGLRRR